MTRNRWSRTTVPALALAGLLAGLLAGCSGAPPSATGPAPVTAVPAVDSPSPSPGSPAAGGSGTLVPLDQVTSRLDAAIQQVMGQAGVPGVIVSVSTPDSRYEKAFGIADKATGEQMSTGLNTRMGSVTKTFTVTALLRLVDQGKVGLDDPIGKYIEGVPNGDRITLRQLAGMRSGLFPYTSDEEFVNQLLADPNRPWSPQELLPYSFRHPVDFEPGAQFEYSNTNTVLLGLVVEKVTGQPLRDVIAREVSEPAGLDRTLFPVAAEFPDPHAHGYTNQTPSGAVTDATDWDPSWGWAAGAMISDLEDLKSWARVMATGTLLTPATQAERTTWPPTGVPDTSYGLGIFINHGWVGHNGSLPGYQTVAVYLPAAQATLVIISNTDIAYQGSEPSTLLARAITEIVSPDNVYDFPAASATASPTAPATGSGAGTNSGTGTGERSPAVSPPSTV
ncbi:serine hydrolase domain-containing protein [Kitasatospora sp. NPDC004240]